MPDVDRVAATLAGRLDVIRAHADLSGPRFNPNFTCDVHVPHLLKAVETALAFHEEFDGTCGSCCDAYGDPVAWPCGEFTDITAALAGKEAD